VATGGRSWGARKLNTKPENISRENVYTDFDWEALDLQVYAALQETQAALEEALAATQRLNHWVKRLQTVSAFMRQVESGLAEVRHQLKESPQARRSPPAPSTAPRADTVGVSEPWPLEPGEAEPEAGEELPPTALEAQEAESRAEPSEVTAQAEAEEPPGPAVAVAEEPSEPAVAEAEEPSEPAVAEAEEPPAPAEEEPLGSAPSVAEVSTSVRLQIESSETNIDLMVVERALRETPGVADVDLLDYAGKRARVLVTFKGGERPKEVADPERLAANVQEHLAKLTWDGSLAVSATE
jgi:hypothetical protein